MTTVATAPCRQMALTIAFICALAMSVVVARPIAAQPYDAGTAGSAAPTELDSFESCGDLLAHLKETASAHVTPYGFGSQVYGPFNTAGLRTPTLAFTGASGDAAAGSLASTDAEGNAFSGTNIQEPGVDEADFVKTDGKRMVVLREGLLTVIDVRNPSRPLRRATLRVAASAGAAGDGSILMDGDRVLVMLPRWHSLDGSAGTSLVNSFADVGEPATDVTMVSIADIARPKVLDRATFNGADVAARLVGHSARVVVNSLPLNLAFVTPQSNRSAADALATNRQIIDRSTIADWLPTIRRGGTTTPAVGCTDVHTPSKFAGIGMTSIHTIAMADQLRPEAVSLLADSGLAYASTSRLYVTAAEWVDPSSYSDPQVWDRLATSYTTDIHEFDVTRAKATYVASGEVRGHPLNQWSMSERDGNLRIATTDGPTWFRPGGATARESESFMSVLAPTGGVLAQIGQVGGIGRGESIRAVRYDGDTAYVVTFRQIDPFYVLDLSKPTAPRVVGSLKIAGYSGYLHPVGPGRVVGVGGDVSLNGNVVGAKVTLFDVSNRGRPKALSSYTLPGASTQVDLDAKAFLWWAPARLAMVPMQQWGPFVLTGAFGLRITDRAITPVGVAIHARPKEDGHTACRPLSAKEIEQAGYGSGYVVIDCRPADPVAVVGFTCDSYDAATVNEDLQAHFRLAAGHVLGICYLAPAFPPIDRSIVVGDRVLTLSAHALLSSDLATLMPGRFLDV